ncbi:MAG: acyl carrier protein [Eubacteriales bacterium]
MILDKLKEIFAKVMPNADTSNITRESNLVTDLGINSLTMMLLAIMVEDEFGFHFEGSAKLETVGDIVDYVAEKTELRV